MSELTEFQLRQKAKIYDDFEKECNRILHMTLNEVRKVFEFDGDMFEEFDQAFEESGSSMMWFLMMVLTATPLKLVFQLKTEQQTIFFINDAGSFNDVDWILKVVGNHKTNLVGFEERLSSAIKTNVFFIGNQST